MAFFLTIDLSSISHQLISLSFSAFVLSQHEVAEKRAWQGDTNAHPFTKGMTMLAASEVRQTQKRTAL